VDSSTKNLQQWLKDQNTDHGIIMALITGLQKWHNDSTAPLLSKDADNLMQAQNQIGWDYIFDRWLSKQWHLRQKQVWRASQSCHFSRRWTLELIKKLWNITWDLWAHQNGILHTSSLAQVEIVESLMNQQIQAIYKVGTQPLPCRAFHLLRSPLADLLRLPLTT